MGCLENYVTYVKYLDQCLAGSSQFNIEPYSFGTDRPSLSGPFILTPYQYF